MKPNNKYAHIVAYYLFLIELSMLYERDLGFLLGFFGVC